jgi:anti-sigma B factor antagonist
VSDDDGEQELSESITINVQRLPADNTIVQVVGDATGHATAAMQRTLSDELTRSPALLVVDLSEVQRIGAGAINTLALAAAIAGESDIAFCLVDGHGGHVSAALAEAEVHELFEVFSSVNEAMEGSG